MTAVNPNHEPPKTDATPELKRLLGQLTNGDAMSIVENGVVIGRLSRAGAQESTDAAAPWDLALSVSASVPPAEWSGVPADLAKNFDHYRYGHAKEE